MSCNPKSTYTAMLQDFARHSFQAIHACNLSLKKRRATGAVLGKFVEKSTKQKKKRRRHALSTDNTTVQAHLILIARQRGAFCGASVFENSLFGFWRQNGVPRDVISFLWRSRSLVRAGGEKSERGGGVCVNAVVWLVRRLVAAGPPLN
jgi:hypothetical protein